jgi:hypothetical protein
MVSHVFNFGGTDRLRDCSALVKYDAADKEPSFGQIIVQLLNGPSLMAKKTDADHSAPVLIAKL